NKKNLTEYCESLGEIILCVVIILVLLKRNLVMLVDDEIDIIGLFTEILTLNGISVRPFTNPKEALDYFEQSHDNYRLVISDVRMSPMSGVEFVAKIKKIDSEVNVILMTAFEIEGNQLKEINTDEFFNKPIRMNDLVRIVKKYVE
ncbi:MAG: response regulator, partial [Nitrososphaeraceae archaeon]|nr:response regulator [Nitrososphaeraceae archaeon]